MSYEKAYYEYDGFWSDFESSYRNNIDKIKITFRYLSQVLPAEVLDAACGNGVFTNMLLETFPGVKVVAFDRSEAALRYVKSEKYVADINKMPFSDQSFDCVIAHDVIEHLPVGIYEQALKELARVAKRHIIIAVPHDEKVLERSTQCPQCKATFNYDLHMRSFSKETMRSLFKNEGFVCRQIDTCDTITQYYGQKLYGRLFYPEINKRFASPICPVCGYEPEQRQHHGESKRHQPLVQASGGLLGVLKRIPKKIWPKYSFDYEMVALFEKEQ